jgi:hypothetical protein
MDHDSFERMYAEQAPWDMGGILHNGFPGLLETGRFGAALPSCLTTDA